jgi:hypothetical protein
MELTEAEKTVVGTLERAKLWNGDELTYTFEMFKKRYHKAIVNLIQNNIVCEEYHIMCNEPLFVVNRLKLTEYYKEYIERKGD